MESTTLPFDSPDSYIINRANVMLKAAKIKYEDGIQALQNLPNIESDIQDELNAAKDLLLQGLKLLSTVQKFLQENSATKLKDNIPHAYNTYFTEPCKIQENELKIEIHEDKESKISCDPLNSTRIDNDNAEVLKLNVIVNCDTDNTCDLCNKTFKTNSYLKIHKQSVHKIDKEFDKVDTTSELDKNVVDTEYNDNDQHLKSYDIVQLSDNCTVKSFVKFYCSFCTSSFSIKRHLNNHIKNLHDKDNSLKNNEEIESLELTRSNRLGEKNVTIKHSKKANINCPICNEKFKPLLIKIHILKHFIDNPFKCELCEQIYSLKSQLNKHLKEAHNDIDFAVNEKSSKHSLQCKVCNKIFNSLLDVKTHIPECSKNNLSVDIDQKYILSDKGQYICDQCGKKFSTKEILSQHVLIHGDFNFNCQECNKKFKKKKLYTRHLRIHKGDRPYKCDQCPRDYLDMASLKDHQVIHGTDKTFKCEVCLKEFFYAQSYKYHMRSHSGEKPYSCDICGKSFTQHSNLKDHMKIHTGDKPFKCEICGKDFARKTDLGHHLKTHTGERPYKCDRCSMTFARTGRLSAHMRSHTGERPFKCDVCTKAFREKSGLNRHLMIHNGLRPHKCDLCGQGFIQSGALNSHQKSQHPKEVTATIELAN